MVINFNGCKFDKCVSDINSEMDVNVKDCLSGIDIKLKHVDLSSLVLNEKPTEECQGWIKLDGEYEAIYYDSYGIMRLSKN